MGPSNDPKRNVRGNLLFNGDKRYLNSIKENLTSYRQLYGESLTYIFHTVHEPYHNLAIAVISNDR